MDAIDRKIIRELQADGSLTNLQLAERINLSPSPCLRRVKNLIANGLIQGYTALVDQEKYGLPFTAFVSIRLTEQTDRCIADFERAMQELDEVMDCYLMSGKQDYLLRVVSASMKDYEKFIREKLTRVNGISALESNFAFGQVKHKTVYPELQNVQPG